MESKDILSPAKVFDVQLFVDYCEHRNVKKITFSSTTEEYDPFDFLDDYEKIVKSHWCMYPFSVTEIEFTEVRMWDFNTLVLSGASGEIMIDRVDRIELYNTYEEADTIMIHTNEASDTPLYDSIPERSFLFGVKYRNHTQERFV